MAAGVTWAAPLRWAPQAAWLVQGHQGGVAELGPPLPGEGVCVGGQACVLLPWACAPEPRAAPRKPGLLFPPGLCGHALRGGPRGPGTPGTRAGALRGHRGRGQVGSGDAGTRAGALRAVRPGAPRARARQPPSRDTLPAAVAPLTAARAARPVPYGRRHDGGHGFRGRSAPPRFPNSPASTKVPCRLDAARGRRSDPAFPPPMAGLTFPSAYCVLCPVYIHDLTDATHSSYEKCVLSIFSLKGRESRLGRSK